MMKKKTNQKKTEKKKGAEKKDAIKRDWHWFDAQGKVLGRLSTQIAQLLMGKNKPSFIPWQDRGDYVVITNAARIGVSGRKDKQKIYYRHSGFPRGLKEETLEKLRERKPEEIIKRAVYNMLPKNKLRQGRMGRLRIFAGTEHPYGDLVSASPL